MSSTRSWTDSECPVARTVDLLGDKWSLLIVRDAFDGARRFTQFQQNLGIAKNILSDRLRNLVEDGILGQEPNDRNTRQEYTLTTRGEDLFAVIVSLRQWGEKYAFAAGEQHSVLLDLASNQPIPPLQPVDVNGAPLLPGETYVLKQRTD